MSKVKNKVRISFVGENAKEVTGSSILIEYNDKKILVENGLYQGKGSLLEQYKINNKHFPYKVKEIDYLIVLHSHMDHVGLIPKMFKFENKCKIISPVGLKDLFEVMAKDSVFIMNKEAEDLTKKMKREFEPIYTDKEVCLALDKWEEYPVEEKIQIEDNLTIRFIRSGHIINACQCEIWIKNNNKIIKIGITSDLGNIAIKNDYVEDIEYIDKANLLIGEATYAGNFKHITNKGRKKDLDKIETIVRQTCIENKSKILIPVFALQRTQTILTCLYDLFKDKEDFNVPIIIDSPLALKINEIFLKELKGEQQEKFAKVLAWKNIYKAKEFIDTQQWIESDMPCIFLSCSGMMNAGRSVYVASKLLPHKNNYIIFCGYSCENSLASKIKEGKQKTVTINGESVPCKCQVANLTSFSSHMQRQDLIDYYSNGNFDKIAIVHSEFKDKIIFCEDLQKEINKKNKTNKVICVNKGTEILL